MLNDKGTQCRTINQCTQRRTEREREREGQNETISLEYQRWCYELCIENGMKSVPTGKYEVKRYVIACIANEAYLI